MARLFRRGEFPYVLEADRKLPKDQRTVFKLRVLDPEKDAELQDSIVETVTERGEADVALTMKTAQVAYEILRHGLVGWENFPDGNGGMVEFKHPGSICAKENIECIHPDDRKELANAITEGNSVTEDDAKNSESASG